jgi:hypothetical protein
MRAFGIDPLGSILGVAHAESRVRLRCDFHRQCSLANVRRFPCRLLSSALERVAGCWIVRARANPLSLEVWHFTLRCILRWSWVGYSRPKGCRAVALWTQSLPKVIHCSLLPQPLLLLNSSFFSLKIPMYGLMTESDILHSREMSTLAAGAAFKSGLEWQGTTPSIMSRNATKDILSQMQVQGSTWWLMRQ